ncbi:CoA transferase [Caldimonas thermodepolymerans]|jgi:Predicted acyl-CoA transferases/carnitine dehydratase|uniref:CoA transferase n=1 Tax=Caldimonas thermodepolymerans TaxID=215580 RepID=A0A2S5T116_9BURK|nr:CaiB/BaiF CoA-transferase family protein [Caldimonas thermodepolymerans]PPE68646.1 CoA transferase [Caldimonas thermodepolymerans]QPC30823.1 CoA transferase [Caldimonas thermodepolymerans]RDH94957.1 formyl-CoA transferase [Caldimonas thermodepolymerans]
MSADPAPTALGHLRVLDLSRVLAGPWCGQILADLGAQVIKVERPDEGDDTRHWGPPFLKDADGRDTDAATYYTCANRNKQSVTVDLTRPEGQAIVRELACRSDVLIENFRAGGLARYGLDYATLKELNPRLIYCSITGFGQDGPYAGRAGYDLLVQAASGLMSITGRPDGEPGGGPMRVGVAVIDLFTGVYAATAILAAVEARHRTGRGQYIDMALLDVGMAMLANQAAGYLHTGRVPQRQGNTHPSIVPYQDFPTADGAMLLAVGNDGQFARFCEAAGVPGWSRDPRFATNAERVRHRAVLVPMIESITRQRTTREWVELLEDRAVPCGPINDIGQAFADPQVRARGLRVELPHPRFGQVAGVASPLRLSETPPVVRHAPPDLGQHTEQVLSEVLGYDAARIAALKAQGIV